MTVPNVHVEIALTTDPLTRPGDEDWTRIDTTCPLRTLSTRRGAGLRDGSITTGTASALLDNKTADLLPENTAGTWYPDLTLRRRIRFLIDGTDPVFTGYIDSLPNQWDKSRSDGTVDLTAVDLFALLAEYELAPSVVHQTTADLAPLAYWPLADAQEITVDDVAGANDATFNFATTDSAQLLPYDSRSRPTYSSDVPRVATVPIPPTSQMTVAFWARFTVPSAADTPKVWAQESDDASHNLYLLVEQGEVSASFRDDSSSHTGRVTVSNTAALHHYAWVLDASESGTDQVKCYVDGVKLSFTSDTAFSSLVLSETITGLAGVNARFGLFDSFAELGLVDPATGTFGEFAVWDSALSAADLLSIYEAGATAWDRDRTGTRVGRILDAIGVDAGDRDIATGAEVCGPTTLGGNALEYLRKIAATEGGALFVSADGKVTFQEQYLNDPTPLDVIGDDGCPYSAISVDYSPDRMINAAEVTREIGPAQSYQDAAAAALYGPRSITLSTLHATPSGARSRAAVLVVRNKDLRTQVRDVTLESHSTAPTSVTVDTEIGDPYTIQYQPPGVGSPEQVLARVSSISQQFTPSSWRTTLELDQEVVLPDLTWDTPGAGFDQAVWAS